MKSRLFLFALVAILLISCGKSSMKHRPIKLALSSATDNYINWIHRIDSTVVIYDLKNLKPDSAISILKKCDGLLLTGGEDVFPGFYGQISDTARCETNIVRDSLEFYLITKAEKLKLPILGICRGLQIMNVAHGGKLIIDIPKDFPGNVNHRLEDYTKAFHRVNIAKETLLNQVCSSDTGWVTTNHHQGIASLGENIRISARSQDLLPEAIEWSDPDKKGYFMAVQWHPERMSKDNPLSDPIGRAFLQACIIYSVIK